ncbi:gamma-glutamyltransferase [Paenalkalicoccus suaedae]|uniref:Gamma-glutamyltransferase n=1 Tax=Paenalkalicoccus suaedae TaxID=2592382 RepID=A0A859FAY0_9BACI|nr:gamma-glutamyltransferase [Paenalkalicoccus suaedae]QKS70100.1 gamma-glutamyltransferase [Paenalkalicoccus suaedae]
MNYRPYLKLTHLAAAIVFVGLVAWNFYFQSEFDPFREPYSGADFQERQVASVDVTPEASPEENNENTTNVNNEPEPQSAGVYGVSSVHPLAAEVGMNIMEEGGNAIDAAIAVSFMLNVVEPYGSGIGGGGLMLVHDPEEGPLSYDYREAAAESGAWPERGIAVPGLVRGMERIHEEHANLDWATLIQPAIDVAREGFQVGAIFNQQTGNAVRYLAMTDAEREIFFPGGQALNVNDTLVQEDLAQTLEIIRDQGADGFYEGPIADMLSSELAFTSEDLAAYEAQSVEPVSAQVGEQTIYGGPSPSSGTVVVQALQMAEQIDLSQAFPEVEFPEGVTVGSLINYPELQHIYMHIINEISKVTYSSRLDTLGDPAFDEIDHSEFTNDAYIDELVSQISLNEISDADVELFDSPAEEADSRHTTHFVIVDDEGRMVSATHSLGEFFGSGIYKNGFFLNNQLNNFSENDESINRYEPGKRPRTFVAPMIFEEQGKPVLGLGSPGGRRIPAMVFQTIMQYNHGFNDEGDPFTLQEAIEAPRFYNEDEVVYTETELSPEAAQQLRSMNYSVVTHTSPLFYGGIQGLGLVLNEDGQVESMYGGGDARRNGAWQIGSAD